MKGGGEEGGRSEGLWHVLLDWSWDVLFRGL